MDNLKKQIDRELQDVHFDVEGFMAQWGRAKKERRGMGKKIMAAAFAAALFCGGKGAYASVNHFLERGSQLTQGEKDAYVEDITNAPADADAFSRELTEAERERREVLMGRYLKEGLFPEEKLQKINSVEELVTDRVCFLPETSTFYLPERELTDEDLLQIIDHDLMVDYSLEQAGRMEQAGEGQEQRQGKAAERGGQKQQEQAQAGSGQGEIGMDEAVAQAKEAVQKVYEENVDGMEVEAEQVMYGKESGQESYSLWRIDFVKPGSREKYHVQINPQTGDAEGVSWYDKAFYDGKKRKPGNLMEQELVKEMEQKACMFIGRDSSAKKGYLQVIAEQDGYLSFGSAHYYFEMEDGKFVDVCYNAVGKKITSFYAYSQEDFEAVRRSMEEQSNQDGCTYQFMEID
ncbi:MAG: hypothetical protein HFH38_14010 [Lachnospiraceae bacterium]|nr:hypothetical protein [Lachnospiraceae bacterium]